MQANEAKTVNLQLSGLDLVGSYDTRRGGCGGEGDGMSLHPRRLLKHHGWGGCKGETIQRVYSSRVMMMKTKCTKETWRTLLI